ncbi:PHD finger protein 7-like isoform X2 [Phasianus colchicus]|uniref:PHD finger protein 7-like isoform X2 n=1 Tax=Phasianus colchicus TaxID=9054 RepID=UPI00129E80B5|nr:PHD finger protein 7-like isoform X2 [Phasianus colchicus]
MELIATHQSPMGRRGHPKATPQGPLYYFTPFVFSLPNIQHTARQKHNAMGQQMADGPGPKASEDGDPSGCRPASILQVLLLAAPADTAGEAAATGTAQCAICLEAVEGCPSYNTLICPSCTSAQFHRHCIQGQALRAALHHFRCPLCQDMQAFQAEMFRLGIKIPDRDAAWEVEEGAFHDLYQRHSSCDTSLCLCPIGWDYSENTGPWRMLLCSSCGSCGTHQHCSAIAEDAESWECSGCSGEGTAPSVSAAAQ